MLARQNLPLANLYSPQHLSQEEVEQGVSRLSEGLVSNQTQ